MKQNYNLEETIKRQHQHGIYMQLNNLAQSNNYSEAMYWQVNILNRLDIMKRKFPDVQPIYKEMYVNLMTIKTVEWNK